MLHITTIFGGNIDVFGSSFIYTCMSECLPLHKIEHFLTLCEIQLNHSFIRHIDKKVWSQRIIIIHLHGLPTLADILQAEDNTGLKTLICQFFIK